MKEQKVLAAFGGVCLVLLHAACGGSSGSPAAPAAPAAPSPAALGPIDPALVGTWSGRILSGPYGPGDLTMNLSADARARFGGSGRYCGADGNWGVSGAEFTSIATDCDGVRITAVAPVSSTSLDGRFTTSRGGGGTFSVARQ